MKIYGALYFWINATAGRCIATEFLLDATLAVADTNVTLASNEMPGTPFLDLACAEFNKSFPVSSGWLHSDCTFVWSRWVATLETQQINSLAYHSTLRETMKQLHLRGSQCMVDSFSYPDGTGSATIRHLATWMFAEEMGCKWILPRITTTDNKIDNGYGSLYCHKTVSAGALHQIQSRGPRNDQVMPCTATNWQLFFHFDKHAVSGNISSTTETIHPGINGDSDGLVELMDDYNLQANGHHRWDNLRFHLGKSTANRFFQLVGSWNDYKRAITRDVLRRFRESFYEFPRPWFDQLPNCMYSSSKELNFAVHIRLGDRTNYLNGFELSYLNYLESFFATVTASVTGRGFDAPIFHVFSETSSPCPSEKKETFAEFPNWPVETYQILPCLKALTPEDCPEKRTGAPRCSPRRSGIFRISGKPLYLHVGIDVRNDLSCMIQADGILMGCSTFGQIAGVLNQGLKFFSFECLGYRTPNHYKMMPPLAIAERGDLWVPMSGSWHDPEIMSIAIFEAALDAHLERK